MNAARRIFGIVPAAGRSRRMGTPKLLLPFGDGTIIGRVLDAWCASQVAKVVVVVRAEDQELARECARWPVDVACPEQDPPDMKASIQYGLRFVSERFAPQASDAWMVAPADLPHFESRFVNGLVAHEGSPEAIVAARFGSRPGHPVLMPWSMAEEVFRLPADEGIRWLFQQHPVHYVDFPPRERIVDVDTPEEYDELRNRGKP